MQLHYTAYLKKYAFKAFLLFCLFMMMGSVAHAQYATGGSSPYRDQVLWLTWGGGENGTPGQPLNAGATSEATIPVAGSSTLVVSCSITNITHSGGGDTQLNSYRPGDWSGDVLDDLYNIGGTGGNNQLINGISRDGGVSDFTIGCTATLDGQPFRLNGLVMADAEAIATSVEYVEATAAGIWNVVEMPKNPDAGTYMARKTNNGGMQTIRFGPGTDDETAAVTFLSFTNPSSNVSMDFSIEGGGVTAIAIGLLTPYGDFGDAPKSYGNAMHLVQDLQFQDDNLPADGNQYDLNDSGYEPGGLAPSEVDYIGSQGPDTELEQQYDANAEGDDNYPTSGSIEEDAWPDNYTITVLQEGETLSETIPCTGNGTVAGWIDFNRSGTFDNATERTESACSGGTANLSWVIPSDLTPGVSYVRLRYGTIPSELADPTGTASDGEAEDHVITITAPQLSITKSSNATGGEWSVGEQNAQYNLTVTNNGPVGTGDPPSTSVEPVTVRDQLPTGIEPDWTGTYTTNGWSCTYTGQDVTCTTDQLINANGDQSDIQLPVQITEDAIGQATNYASVAGGRDPFNDGNAPGPGPSCSDGDHCASNQVTVSDPPNLAPCNETMYMSQSPSGDPTMTLYEFDTSSNPFAYEVIGSQAPPYYNATGYNLNDYYLYAIQQSDDQLVRVGDDGQAVELGAVTGLPESVGTAYFGGEIAPDGTYYVMQGGGQNAIYEIDISSQSVTNTIPLTQSLEIGDITWYDGLLYTVDTNDSNLYSIDPNSGTTTQIGSVGSGPGTVGAMFGASNGIFGVSNNGNGFYAFNLSTGEATQISDAPGASLNDGAKCVTTPLIFPGDLAVDKDDGATSYVPGEEVTYTIEVSSNGPFGAQGAVVNDDLPSGVTDADWTCSTTGGGTCGASSGTGGIDGVEVGLQVGAVATFTLTMQVPSDFTGDLINTAEVIPGDGTDDQTPENNEDDDTNTVDPSADLAVTKTVDNASPSVGDDVIFTIQLTNNGPSEAAGVEVVDQLPSGYSFVSSSATAGSYDSGSGLWTVGSLADGASASLEITATVLASGDYENTATASGDTPDPTPDNNAGGSTPEPEASADVSLTKEVDSPTPSVGTDVVFTLTATNDGPSDAQNVSVTDQLPSGYEFVSSNASSGSYDETNGTWTIGALADGATTTLDITATVHARGDYENTATVSSDTPDPTPDNNTGGSTPEPEASADVALAKTLDTNGPYNIGQQVQYTIDISNNGPSDATSIELTDTPSNLTVTGVSGSGCSSLPCTVPSLASGSSTSLTVTATIDAGAFDNTATATPDENDPDPSNNTDDSGNGGNADPVADVSLTKTVNPQTPDVGQNVTFTLTATNNGPSEATGVNVVDQLPAGYDFVSSSTATGSYAEETGAWTIESLADGTSVTLDITATVLASGEYENTGSASANEEDPDPGNNDSSAEPDPVPSTDIMLTKSLDTAGPFNAGQQVGYTITIDNNGPSEATGIEVTDTPTNLTIDNVSGSGCSSFPCTIASLASGGQTTINVTATIDAAGAFDNASTATPAEDDPTMGNNTDNDGDTGNPSADLSLTKTVDNPTPNVGDDVTFTITAANAGPSEATGVSVADQLPSGYSFVSAIATTGSYDNGTGTWTVGTLADGASATLDITATVLATGDYENTASVTGDTPDPDPGNNTGGSTPNPNPSADIALTKTLDTAGPYNAGQQVGYTITIDNNGPSEATGIEVTDTPTNLDITSISGSGCSSFPCTIPNLANGSTTTISITGTVQEKGAFGNIATAEANEEDPNPDNNTDNDGDSGNASADVAVTKVLDTAASYHAGQEVTYTLTLSNNGPSDATGILVEEIPTNLTITGVSGSGCSSFPCTIPNLADGSQTTISVTATIDAAGSFDNEVSATPTENDPNEDNNTSNDGGSGDPSANISIDKTLDTPGPYNAGQEVQYTITVSNAGPSAAQSVEIVETPTNLTIMAVSGAGCSSFPCTIPTVANGGQQMINVTATIDGEGPFQNGVSVASDTDDPDPSDNDDNDPGNGGNSGTSADVSITKSVDNPAPSVGTDVTFTLEAANAGPSEATGVEVTDQLPSGYQFVSSSASAGSYDETSGTWTIGSLASGADATLDITATVQASGDYANTATVTGDTPDPDPGNNTGGSTPGPNPSADVALTKTLDTAGPYNAGQQVDYTITIDNNGPSEATGIEVTDTPTNLTIDNVSGSGCGSFPCTIPSLASGSQTTITVTATIDAAGAFDNTATATPSEDDPTPENNTGTDGDNAGTSSDLSLTKMVDNPAPTVGEDITFTLTVSSAGPSEATGVEVTDQLPSGYQFVSSTASTGSYDEATGTWTIGSLADGATVTLDITATVLASGDYANTARVSGDPDDPNPGNETGTSEPGPVDQADVSVTKSVDNATPSVGENVTFTITASNAGPSDAANVVVTEQLPSGYTFVSASTATGSYDEGNGTWTIGSLADGASATLDITAAVNASGDYQNTATITTDTDDPDPGNNTGGSTPNPDPSSDLSVTKTVDNPTPNVGDDVIFMITATNNGPSEATGVDVADQLPSGYMFVSASPSTGSYDEGSGQWTIGSLADGASATLDITATVLASGDYVNTATITGDPDDPNPGNETGTSEPGPVDQADLSIDKTLDTSGPYSAGQQITYTLQVVNEGPSSAEGITVSDNPTNLSIDEISSPCEGGFPCDVGTLAAGEQIDLILTATIDAAGEFNNTATVESNTPDSDPSNNEDEDPDNGGDANPATDISVAKTLDTPGSYNAGQQVNYTITIDNNGPSDATDIEVTDIPTNLTIDEVSGACTSLPCTIGSLASGDQAIINVTATIEAAGAFDNEVTATPNEDDSTPENNTDNDGNGGTADPSADLVLTKTLITVGPFNAGQQIQYTIDISNNGPSEATNVNVNDTPTNLSITSVSGACTSLPCTLASLDSGDAAAITVTATIDEPGSFSNAASVTASEDDPNPGNNTDKDGDSGGRLADLSLTKTLDTAGPYVDGQEVQYTITVSNAGPSRATGALVIDTPTNLTVNNVSGACSSLPCTISSLASGAQKVITLTATIDEPGAFENTAMINAAQDDPDPDNNTDGDGNNSSASADVSVVKNLDTEGPYVDGQQVQYALTISNAGPTEATDIEVTDTPTNLSIENVSGACTSLPCTIPSLASGANTTMMVTATIDGPGTFDNTVTVTPAEDDPTPSNNTDNSGNGGSADASADLSVIKTADNGNPSVGNNVTFTITVSNNGPSEAQNVSVTDQLPSGYDFVSATATTGSYDETNGLWTIGSLGNSADATLDITATMLASGDYANTATVSGDIPDPDPGNNTGGSTPEPEASADIEVTKNLDTAGPYAVGQQVDYTIRITNNGPSVATNVNITDTPTNLTIDDVSGACTSLPCTLGSLASGDEATIAVTATIDGSGSFGNTATATADEDDPNPGNNTGQDGDSGSLSADVALTKTLVTSGPYTDGQQIEYAVIVSNKGPSDATGVLVTDTPTNLSIDDVSGACSTLPCTIASIPDGTQKEITVLATIDGSGDFDNEATATPNEDDPTPENNTDDTGNSGSANASADLSINKNLTTAGPYSAGQTIEYELVISNDGPSAATGVEITESPTNLTITSVSGSGCSSFPCTISSLASGAQATVNVTATIDAAGSFQNAATVGSDTPDPDPDDNDGTGGGGSANASVDVSLDKTLNTSGPYKVNQKVSYTLFVANDGPSEATDIVVTDTPENLTIVGVSGSGCSSLPCTIPSLSAGAQTSINVTATIDGSGNFDNTATATPSEDDADPSDNTNNDGGTANALADVSIAKSLQTAGPYKVDQEVSYRLIVTNDGPSIATDIQVTDTPQNLTITSVGGACSELPCSIPSLAVDAQMTINVTATIDAAGDFNNTATAESETMDDPDSSNNTDADENNSGTAQKITDISVEKTLNTEGPYTAGQELEYTIAVTNAGPSEATDIQVTDTPTNLTISEVSGAGCSSFPCTISSLPAGEQANINVIATIQTAGSFDNTASAHGVEEDINLENNDDVVSATAQAPELRIIKEAQNLTARPGGFVPYTITIDNLSDVPVSDVRIIDTPALGLSYVEESLGVNDIDDSGLVEGLRPLIFGNIDLPAGGQAVITYILRVGATALPGELRNVAVASKGGTQLSGEDDASVILEGDPIMDETRILGSVFRDHDQDGWQDIATATDLHAQGGFAAGAYMPNSTTIDRGDGPQSVPDGSAPLLQGLDLSELAGRRSVSSALDKQQIVISQRLRSPEFTDDFVVTTSEGTQLTMNASGEVSRDLSGTVKRGTNSQKIRVDRQIKQLDNGQYRLDYIITNAGFDDWGLPGARLATPQGLVIETDAFGRYHIEAVDAGNWRRGRNYIVKVDDSSLPRNSSYTTENPLVRRVTTGAPIRFDFGVYIPTADLMIEKMLLTEKPFEAGQELSYNLIITNNGPSTANNIRIDDKGDNITITDVSGASCTGFPCTLEESLEPGEQTTVTVKATLDTIGRFENKAAAWAAEDDPRPENNNDWVAAFTPVDTTTTVEEPPPALSCRDAVMLPRDVHFETDQSIISPESAQMLDRVALFLRGRGKCTLELTGHTDHDLGYEYNKALSLRRAKAIQAYLIAAGVPADQIKIGGVSFSEPAVEEQDILDKTRNRRVSFSLSPSGDDTRWLQQIEDLQVDRKSNQWDYKVGPIPWDYVFDFRHNAVPDRLHLPQDGTALNSVSQYLIKRIGKVLLSYPEVQADLKLMPSGKAGLDQKRVEMLRQALAATGISDQQYEVAVNYTGNPSIGRTVYIEYRPAGTVIPVNQEDDLKLKGIEPYPELLKKAWKMLQDREDSPLLEPSSDSLSVPKGITVSGDGSVLSNEGSASLSRLGSYLKAHPGAKITIVGSPASRRQLQQARKFLINWGINDAQITIETRQNENTSERFIQFEEQ